MEDNRNYTYTHKKSKNDTVRLAALIVLVISVALLLAAIIAGAVSGSKKAKSDLEAQQTTLPPATTLPPETTAAGIETTYKVGTYTVNTGGSSLLLRKEPKKDADAYLEISDGTQLEVYEIFYDGNATEEAYSCWGKCDHLGYAGWVAMAYLDRDYSDSVVTPDDLTTAPANNTPEETLTWRESLAYSAGDYNVSTSGSTLRFKETPSRDGEVMANLPDGLLVTVTKVVETEGEDEYRYWGLISYDGKEGYVSMAYLKPAE